MQIFLPETNNRFLEINTGYRKILSTVQYRIPFPTTTHLLSLVDREKETHQPILLITTVEGSTLYIITRVAIFSRCNGL